MIRYIKPIFFACLLLALTIIISSGNSLVSAASVFYVSTTGSNANDCLSPAAPCGTINGALGKAAPGDTVEVTAETYYGTGDQAVYVDRDITLSGGWNEAFTDRTGHTTVDGQNVRIVLEITETSSASVDYFILQNGYNSGGSGGILNWGTLVLNQSTVQNNQGGVFEGGGISNYGTLTVQWSTIRNNIGTGVYNWDYAGLLTILNSTINNNTDGVGVRVYNQNATLINSTISGNTNTSYYYDGGGIYYGGGTDKTLILKNVTITGNRATYSGGGIYMGDAYGGQLLMEDSIISGNFANVGSDCYGPITSQGYNIVGDSADCTFIGAIGDQLDVNPLIGVLQDNGGPTYTHWLYDGSSAIDAGNPAGCPDQLGDPLTIDQRGYTRPLDGDSDGNNICDIGAFEADPNNLPPNPGILWYVTLSGDDTNDCISPSTACASINGAAFKAGSGDSIYVATGVYTAGAGDEVVLIDKNLTISGGWNNEFNQQTGYTTVDGQNIHRGITIKPELNAWLERLFIKNGLSLDGYGGGIYIGYSSKVKIYDAVVYANFAGNTDPYHPSQQNGGGIGMATFGRLTLNNSLVIGNSATSSGGGIYSGESTLIVNDSTIIYNTAGLGGGIASKISGQIELYHSLVTNNISGNWGGGIDLSDTNLILDHSAVTDNIAGGSGGGINGHRMTIENSTISGNFGATGGGIYSMSDLEIRNSAILYNSAIYGNGGGIYSSNNLILVNTTIAYNTADNPYTAEADGGGIFRAGGPDLQASNVTIARNVAKGDGGGIWSNNSPITFRNTLIADNQAGSSPNCIGTIHSDGYNLVGDITDCSFIPSSGDMTDADPGLARPFGDPGVVALRIDSLAIDGGNPGGCVDQLDNPIIIDQIGTVRPLDGNGDGTFSCDIGAFEYNPAAPPQWFYLPMINRTD